ncbi:hypothetical protein RND71_016044 [Anisodus tanguticus]|uniref:F-box/LRR-repeat protein 15/At3g58940/PEG3-like LRR domain-containing protein n=1 Tax=Anisodus tanguticus TaxID=243964 RepID=A0AAE1S940_9SOLA|nr:hypothetical protein RND71_016044 [Anisodus tanguticus]
MGVWDEHIVNVLSGCPALETMELYCVEGFSRLDVRSSKLKRLKLNRYSSVDDGRDHSLEINAPHLQELEILGDLYDLKCRLVDVSSVVNAKLTFNIVCIKDVYTMAGREFDHAEDSCDYHQVFMTLVQDYLQKLSCAVELTMGTWFTEVLCMLQFKGVAIPKLECKYLTLELHMNEFNLYAEAVLLQTSPQVGTLNIDITATLADLHLVLIIFSLRPEHSESMYVLESIIIRDKCT